MQLHLLKLRSWYRRRQRGGGTRVASLSARVKPRRVTVYSYPKAGRTWTTYLWYHYILALLGEKVEASRYLLRPTANPKFQQLFQSRLTPNGVPEFRFTHGVKPEDGPDFAKGLDAKISRTPLHVVIVRRPSRILSSYYHHIHAKPRPAFKPPYPDADKMKSVSDIVHSPFYGIERIIDYYGVFDRNRSNDQFVLYYEDLLANTKAVFRNLLAHAGYAEISEPALDHAIEQSRFDRLQQMQRAKRLAVGRSPESNALRFRVGGDDQGEMSVDDQDFILARIRQSGVGILQRYVREPS